MLVLSQVTLDVAKRYVVRGACGWSRSSPAGQYLCFVWVFCLGFFFVGTLETVSVRNAIDSRLAGNPTCELNTHRGKRLSDVMG